MDAVELVIETLEPVPAAVLAELGSFESSPDAAGGRLRGQVADAAALWGVLHRLHRAGLSLRSVQRVPHRRPAGASDHVVLIDVEGHAAGVVARAVAGTQEVSQGPTTTRLVVRVADDDDLFRVLTVLEGLALNVRSLHID